MNLVINATNLKVGGGLQVAVSFLCELALLDLRPEDNVVCAVSKEVFHQLEDYARTKLVLRVVPSTTNPSSIRSRFILNRIVKEINADIVFTIFGPAYWKPAKAIHVVGFALPWLIYNSEKVLKRLGWLDRLKVQIIVFLQKLALKREVDICITETLDVANRVAKLLNISGNDVHVVSNTASKYFLDRSSQTDAVALPKKNSSVCYILTVAYPHVHKNLEVIKEVSQTLGDRFMFIVTLSSASYYRLFGDVCNNIINVGPVRSDQCPGLYRYADAILLPSFLECFSANYPEAFISEKIILTSDLPFSHTVCQDAAYYFDPEDPDDIARVIKLAFEDKKTTKEKLAIGKSIFNSLDTATSRAEKYISICRSASLGRSIGSAK